MNILTTVTVLMAVLCACTCGNTASAASREAQWKAVEEAISKGLPQSAITNLEPIIAAATKEKAYAEAVKAIAQKVALEGTIQGNKPEERIVRLEKEMARMEGEALPLMQALLGDWYWSYFQQNRWRFMQRTRTAEAPGADFTTWDLPRLFTEIDKHFQAALAHPATKKVPVAEWDPLLVKGTMPDSYRPTLYDFVAYEALEFYTSGEQAAARPQGAFEVDATSPALSSVEEFLAWQPWRSTADTNSSAIRAIKLFQDLLRFHQQDPAPAHAFAHADIERLTWAWNTAFGEEKNERYKSALAAFVKREADSEISAFALERHAQVLMQEDNPTGAHELATRGQRLFPESPGGKLCANLVSAIEAKNLSVVTERVWNKPWPKITIRYKNVDKVHFRAIPYRWEYFIESRNRQPGQLNKEELEALLKMKPALEWQEKLPPTKDFKERVKAVEAPTRLPHGYYFIAASHDPDFARTDNFIAVTDVWVSDLALVTRTRNGKLEGFVLEALSGEPIRGATIEPWARDQQGRRVRSPELRSDANGFFAMPLAERTLGLLFRVHHKGRSLATAEDLSQWRRHPQPASGKRTLFFTDRSLYRPGQMIQYKGLAVLFDHGADNYSLDTNRTLTVIYNDPNGKEIARQKHRANAYGSFSGSFTAPSGQLMGQMQIHTEERDGTTWVRVEEYKRPKFQVELERPKDAVRLGDNVKMKGSAMAYTGAAIDGAQVRYRVVREVQMPWWWGWYGRGRGGYTGGSEEIAHGTVTTGPDGSFEVPFEARPDPKVLPKNEPSFIFAVNVDVTDAAGETRSDNQHVRVGYTALEARMQAEPWQSADTPVEIKVSTQTLDGEPQVAEGSIKIHALVPPPRVHRTPIGGPDEDVDGWPDDDASSTEKWPLGKVVAEHGFTTDTNGIAKVRSKLGVGAYRAVLQTTDKYGKAVSGLLPIQVVNPDAKRLDIKVPTLFAAPKWEVLPGEEFIALWGTGYERGRAFIEIERRHELIERYWTTPGRTQQRIRLAVDEAMRGGFTIHITQVRENRSYLQTRNISVPWRDKQLDVKWEHFVSKLVPGQRETWTAVITPPQVVTGKNRTEKARSLPAEMVATLYDASLDAFASHRWPQNFGLFAYSYTDAQTFFANMPRGFNPVLTHWNVPMADLLITHRSFPEELQQRLWWDFRFRRTLSLGMMRTAGSFDDMALTESAATAAVPASAPVERFYARAKAVAKGGMADKSEEPVAGEKPNLDAVSARKNLNETAFFFPHLTTDSNGAVRITFSMPEALTRWKFMGVAHDRELRHGYLEGEAVTAKDLMVQPNPPRFLREGDEIEFTVKVSNVSDEPQNGTVRLTFAQAMTGEAADGILGNKRPEQQFDVPARQSRSFSWRITVPDGCGFISYKAVAATAKLSDGEEGAVPVLSRKVLITESLPLPIRGPETKKFEFTKLVRSGDSDTLRHENFTLQMVSNPAWYAVMALPYLMEFPHECSEQVFNRLYANCLARDIANRDPKIRRVFDLWKNTPALDSPLEKNQELKSVMLEETPWLRQALAESSARKNIGILFDGNRLESETARTMQKLTEMQIGNGQWPWFPGGPGDDYITLYITTGFGRMRHLGVDINVSPALRSLARLDEWMSEEHKRILERPHPELYVPSPTIALFLYGRSFYLKDRPIPDGHRAGLDFFLAKARENWLKTGNRQTQAHLAIALHRFAKVHGSKDTTPAGIVASLKERSVSDEELGMFWRDTEYSWSWFHAPIETQALMIEAFDEITGDSNAVEGCKVWLLKQKQTQDWKTTKATADAVYALLLRGRDLLASDALVQLKAGDIEIKPRQSTPGSESRKTEDRYSPVVESGTGFYEVRFDRADINPKLGQITVRKTDEGVAWGSAHWQYFEDLGKVTPHEGTPLKLKKSLFIKRNTASGPALEPLKEPVGVGDELVVRIELRTDRDMEYVHMKDQRGSGTEPVNVLSRYKYQDGLGYYESTRDTASHFFISYLPKGVYVFEYSSRVQLRGNYQTGVAEIQCMYAPEFNSHSESIPLSVK